MQTARKKFFSALSVFNLFTCGQTTATTSIQVLAFIMYTSRELITPDSNVQSSRSYYVTRREASPPVSCVFHLQVIIIRKYSEPYYISMKDRVRQEALKHPPSICENFSSHGFVVSKLQAILNQEVASISISPICPRLLLHSTFINLRKSLFLKLP